MMAGEEYTSITQKQNYIYSPWSTNITLDGTDGFQFSPNLQTEDVIAAFVNDLNRNCYFDYYETDDTTYPGLDTYIYLIQLELM